nr:hypothetical protein GCM10020241_15250 [Streptoalloteichus tenebrarius]
MQHRLFDIGKHRNPSTDPGSSPIAAPATGPASEDRNREPRAGKDCRPRAAPVPSTGENRKPGTRTTTAAVTVRPTPQNRC